MKKERGKKEREKGGREERNTSGTNNAIHVVSFQHQKTNFPIGTMLHTQNCSRTVWVQLKKQLSWKGSIGGTNEVKFDEKEERQTQRKKKGKNMKGRLPLSSFLSLPLDHFFPFVIVFWNLYFYPVFLSFSLITILASSSN